MKRVDKERVVGELGDMFSEAGIIIVVHYRGLNVADMTTLRGQVREAGASLRVAKNRLARIALKDKPCAKVEQFLDGPTAIAYSDEPVGVSKALCGFANRNAKLVVLGGAMGESVLDASRIAELAKLSSLEELRARLVSLLNAPASKLVRTIAEPGAQIARVMAAHGES